MKKFMIERNLPGAGNLTAEELQSISKASCEVLRSMGPEIQWTQSFVTGDKIYCIYAAANEDLIFEHAERGGFPANSVTEISATIDPTTAGPEALDESSVKELASK